MVNFTPVKSPGYKPRLCGQVDKVSGLSCQWIHVLQGVREDGENMRNPIIFSLQQISITFTLPISNAWGRKSPQASGLQCKHLKAPPHPLCCVGEEGGIWGSLLPGFLGAPHSVCSSKRAEDLPILNTTKATEVLFSYQYRAWRLWGFHTKPCNRLPEWPRARHGTCASAPTSMSRKTLCPVAHCLPAQGVSTGWQGLALLRVPHLPQQAQTSAAVSTHYRNRY